MTLKNRRAGDRDPLPGPLGMIDFHTKRIDSRGRAYSGHFVGDKLLSQLSPDEWSALVKRIALAGHLDIDRLRALAAEIVKSIDNAGVNPQTKD